MNPEQKPENNNPVQSSATQQMPNPASTNPSVQSQAPIIPPASSAATGNLADTKISSPKYWLTALVIYGIYAGLDILGIKVSVIFTFLILAIEVIMLILSYRFVTKLQKASADQLRVEDKYKVVLFMSAGTLLTMLFFLRLKKQLPQLTKTAIKIGWKIFLIEVILGIVYVALVVIPALHKNSQTTSLQSWNANSNVNIDLNKLSTDVSLLSTDSSAPSIDLSEIRTDCQLIVTDATTAKSILPAPTATATSDYSEGFNDFITGGNACVTATKTSNSSLVTQGLNEINDGSNKMNAANSLVSQP